MKQNPIGIIDSGVGGLTVVKEIIRQLPNESIVYIGDTARCPYGSRPKEEIMKFTIEMTKYLERFQIKMLIIACNTATAVALQHLRKKLSIPVLGVVHPGARAAIKGTSKNRIGVIGTEVTIGSKAYETALQSIQKRTIVYGLACPEFVPLVESGQWSGPIAEKTVENSLAPLKKKDIDTLILGCTHYPLLEPLIRDYLGDDVQIISSGEETAREASVILDHTKSLNDTNIKPKYRFFTTGCVSSFKEIARSWLCLENIDVQSINLSNVQVNREVSSK
ncbi:glutamate racemase [Fervidibacillus halotolerans]|uniref:Glutamate racemase n=1 Tax=Fervidibacillus halotolerans TaxID=2980027 RepID=A0A9E8RZG2_9BACI|nr:glutamate racemase [Fervidibacillus halotolerans]WAA11612.1 glutamate racemase [Fervidibacillus halotolerans]